MIATQSLIKAVLLISITFCIGINSFAQNWNEIIKVIGSDSDVNDRFGSSVSISGNFAVVGAQGENAPGDNTLLTSGAAYIY